MSTRAGAFTAVVLVAAAALTVAGRQQQRPAPAADPQPANPTAQENRDQAADREAILKSAREFEAAFNKGDAKAVAAMYSENGESRAAGRTMVGRAAIEQAYAEFFKANPGASVEVLVKSVRFPAKDVAVEEGLLRFPLGPKGLPATSAYVALHGREGGGWKVALSSEGGAGEYRLEDLDWLLGEWTGKGKDADLKLTFTRDPKKPVVTGTFTRTPAGKEPVIGSVRVSLDPETGQIRSWGFEDDGAHSQALWHCDGKAWVLDQRGVLADGTPVAERIILQRVGPDAVTWRAVDRVAGGESLPDTPPMRLNRAKAK